MGELDRLGGCVPVCVPERGFSAVMSNRKIRIVLRNDLSEFQKLRQELESFRQSCGLSEKTLFELNLILEEIVANVISYAFGDIRQHEILIQVNLTDGELTLEVEDDGKPFNPLQVPSPDMDGPLEGRKIGGLGLYLVRELTNSIHYRREDEKNRLVLRKKIAAG